MGVVLLCACARPHPETPEPVAETIVVPDRRAEALEAALHARLAELDSGYVAVAFVDLETGRRIGINEHESMHAASTMKVPVLLELFRQADANRFAITDSIVVTNRFRSIADTSTYSLTPADDSDSTLYKRVGQKAALRELARLMITRSSNLATNILIERLTADSIMNTLAQYNAPGMKVLRGVEDGPAYRKGLNNTTTADGFARALELIARCKVTAERACTEMIDILSAQEFNEMIPAGLPTGTRVAHKTGWITAIQHDGGIVYSPDRLPYVLVVLTRGINDTAKAARVGADLSRSVWESVTSDTWI
ncbi:MAG TPA: serine hydrolase, partial [Longimicrobiales bacterium]|nr:serine hydrolase [Longimicrobiales bacterium]